MLFFTALLSYPAKFSEIENELEKNVAKLFYDMKFDFVGSNFILNSGKEVLGEIDLIFTYDRFLFLIEVTNDNYHRSEKKITYFTKCSQNDFIQQVRDRYDFPNKEIVKLYFDFSKKTFKDESESVQTFLINRDSDIIAYEEDFDYFLNSSKKIGEWVRNDFFDWAKLEDSKKTIEVQAIQYYIQDLPVYCFVESVDILLHSCYISRRRRTSPDLGYQRTLDKKRVSGIQKNIEKAQGLAFPNSILLHTPKLSQTIYNKSECPRIVTIQFPTSFCSCKVIDGQHRLLGFSKISSERLEQYFLTVVALPEVTHDKEFTTFIEINSQHKKMDNNLILHLKSDFTWDDNSKEKIEQIGVKVAELLNDGTLENRIFFGTAGESRGDKITLVTLVNALKHNKQILSDVDSTFNKIRQIFTLIGEFMPQQIAKNGFFNQNIGIRILFRLIYLYERNQKVGKTTVSLRDFISDVGEILDNITIQELSESYGEGGTTTAVKQIIALLTASNPRYERMHNVLTGI